MKKGDFKVMKTKHLDLSSAESVVKAMAGVDQENLGSRSANLSWLWWRDENNCFAA